MIGQIDIRETSRQEKMLRRRNDIEERLQNQREERNHYLEMPFHSGEYSEAVVCMVEEDQDTETVEDMDEESDMEEELTVTESIQGATEERTKNYLDIRGAAGASVRFGVSSSATAGIINGTISDLIRAGHLPENIRYLFCDAKKVFRAREKILCGAIAEAEKNLGENCIKGLFVDARKDDTLVLQQDEKTGRFHRRVVEENHIRVTEEPKGIYVTHYTPEPKSHAAKPAKQAAIGLYEWMKDRWLDTSLEVIGIDTTAEMSGHKGGMLHHVEVLLGRRLFRVFCCLHINELSWTHIVGRLDGPTSSKGGWQGSVGKLFTVVNSMERKEIFEPIHLLEPLVDIPDEVAKKMSTDSSVAWKILKAMVQGKLEPEVSALMCGKLCHSRWLTAGMRCLMLYMSKHNLSRHDEEVLKQLATWVMQVSLTTVFLT